MIAFTLRIVLPSSVPPSFRPSPTHPRDKAPVNVQNLSIALRGDQPHFDSFPLQNSISRYSGSVQNVLDLGHVNAGKGADFLLGGWREGRGGKKEGRMEC